MVEIIRKMEISEVTSYRWKKKYAGMGAAELRRLRQLDDENRRLKRLVTDLTLDKQMLQDATDLHIQKVADKMGGKRGAGHPGVPSASILERFKGGRSLRLMAFLGPKLPIDACSTLNLLLIIRKSSFKAEFF